MPRKVGYARVSTSEQSLDAQISVLREAGCSVIFSDHGVSGVRHVRPGFDRAMRSLKAGDTLIVTRLDRLGRSLRQLIEVNEELDARGVHFESLNEKIDTSTPMGKFVYSILGSVAELEREIIRERTLAGMAEAARHGRFPGRPRLADAEREEEPAG